MPCPPHWGRKIASRWLEMHSAVWFSIKTSYIHSKNRKWPKLLRRGMKSKTVVHTMRWCRARQDTVLKINQLSSPLEKSHGWTHRRNAEWKCAVTAECLPSDSTLRSSGSDNGSDTFRTGAICAREEGILERESVAYGQVLNFSFKLSNHCVNKQVFLQEVLRVVCQPVSPILMACIFKCEDASGLLRLLLVTTR